MGKKNKIEFKGIWYESLAELTRQKGKVDYGAVVQRIKKGWSREKALLTPLFSKNVPRKPIADYHRLASGREWKWLGKALPKNTMTKTEWECDKGHNRTMTYQSVAAGNECRDCYDERIKHPDYVDPRAHDEDEYRRLAEERGFNYLGPYPPNSATDTNWRCAKKHKPWPATYNNISRGTGCPSCKGKRADFDNNLSVLFPDVADSWHPTKNGDLSPSDVTPGSHKKVWWHCPKSKLPEFPHDFPAVIKERTRSDNPTGCPCCSGNEVCPDTCLSFTHPKVAAQWHPTKNGKVKPSDVTYGSGVSRRWICNQDHEWPASPNTRTSQDGRGCPDCFNQTSRLEIRVFTESKTIFKNVEWPRSKVAGQFVDVLLAERRIAIEIDGRYWHTERVKEDRRKNKILEKNGYTVVRLREHGLPLLGLHEIEFKQKLPTLSVVKDLFRVLRKLVPKSYRREIDTYLARSDFANDEEFRNIIAWLPSPPEGESFEDLWPGVAKYWDYERNNPLTPKMFSPGSNKSVWWKCANRPYHPSYELPIKRQIRRKNCDYCLGKKVHELDSLATMYPDLLKDWDYKKNTLSPHEVWPKWVKYEAFWVCSKCDHQWRKAPYFRVVDKKCCPACTREDAHAKSTLKTQQRHKKNREDLQAFFERYVNICKADGSEASVASALRPFRAYTNMTRLNIAKLKGYEDLAKRFDKVFFENDKLFWTDSSGEERQINRKSLYNYLNDYVNR
jgi:hypothetical protein